MLFHLFLFLLKLFFQKFYSGELTAANWASLAELVGNHYISSPLSLDWVFTLKTAGGVTYEFILLIVGVTLIT